MSLFRRKWWLLLAIPAICTWFIAVIVFLHAPHGDLDEWDTTSDSRMYGLVEEPQTDLVDFTDTAKYPEVTQEAIQSSHQLYLQARDEAAVGRPKNAIDLLTRCRALRLGLSLSLLLDIALSACLSCSVLSLPCHLCNPPDSGPRLTHCRQTM